MFTFGMLISRPKLKEEEQLKNGNLYPTQVNMKTAAKCGCDWKRQISLF